MNISKIKNFLLFLTLIIIFFIDFGLIVNTYNKWNETVKDITHLSYELSIAEEYIKNSLNARKEEFIWTVSLFLLANIIGGILLLLYRKDNKDYEITLYNEKEKAIITLKSIGDGVITTDEKGIITFINSIAEKIIGYTNAEVIGKDESEILNLMDITTNSKVPTPIKKVLKDGKIRALAGNVCLINKYHQMFEIEDSAAPIKNKEGQILGVVLVFHDVTKQNEYRRKINENEKILVQQSKMAAMGEMLENIAHQWRQPLSLISTLATGVKLKKQINDLEDDFLIESLDKINNSSQDLSKIIDNFRVFLKYNKHKELFYIDKTFSKIISLLDANLKNKDIKLIINIETIQINSYENELMQIFMNLLNNSIDILNTKTGTRAILVDIHKNESNVIIKFLDNAQGIPMNIINRIFEPYFTTKHKSQGTGIGLFMTQEIIKKQMNGEIIVQNKRFSFNNEEFYGAEFIITIPID